MTRVLALLMVLVGLLVFAAEYTPWLNREELSPLELLAQAPNKDNNSSRPRPRQIGDDYPGRYCCRHCRHNEIPCDGKCLSKKNVTCGTSPGCACPGKP
jgi:hypothetical protein